MSTDADFVDFLVDQMAGAGMLEARKMFGGYTIYCNSKVVALVCDNQLFVKPTAQGRDFIGKVLEAPAYNGARPSFLIEELDDSAWLSQLIKITSDALPFPKPKPKKVKPADGLANK